MTSRVMDAQRKGGTGLARYAQAPFILSGTVPGDDGRGGVEQHEG